MKKTKKAWVALVIVLSMLIPQLSYATSSSNASLIWPNPGAINVTKLAELLPAGDEWQVTLKVEGKNIEIEGQTDVVLVLDRSGSMTEKVEGNITRAQKAKEAAKSFIDQLIIDNNSKMNLGMVSFNTLSSTNASPKFQTIDQTFSGDKLATAAQQKTIKDKLKVEDEFSNNKQQLKSKVDELLSNPVGGTTLASGATMAKLLLEKSSAKNKIIIILSDGAPTHTRANGTTNIELDIKNTAKEIEDEKITVYSIGVGSGINTTAANMLQHFSGKDRYYQVEDSGNALQNIMNSIAREIVYAAKEAKVVDPMGDNFNLKIDAGNTQPTWKAVPELSISEKDIFNYTEENVDIVVSQGNIVFNNGTINWDIGQVTESAPAVLKYRVKMKTLLGGLHATNGVTTLTYKDAYGKDGIKSSDRTDEHGFTVPMVGVRVGSIRVVGYTAKLQDGQWVPINKNGVVVERPDLGYILYNELHKHNDKTNLGFNTYEIAPLTKEGYEYVSGVQNTSVTITQNEPSKTIYLPYRAEDLKEITLEATPNAAENNIALEWNAPSKASVYNYTVYRKDQNESDFQSISIIDIDAYKDANKKIKVLNLHPNKTGADTLKIWMEDNDYGKGVLSITPVKISDFNNNPNNYNLDEYDVIYVGHWDSNNGEGFTANALEKIKAFIESGKGFLVGHDTTGADLLDKDGKYSLGSTKVFRDLFNIKTGYSASGESATLLQNGKIDFDKKFNWGGSEIEVAKTGALMNYPWVIRNPLTIPYTHTAAQIAYGDVWFTFKNGGAFSNRNDYPTDEQIAGGAINFYLTTWNNTAIIQTGHSNGEAKPDEQKILANTLFYLAQKTTDTKLTDHGGQDVTPPTRPQVTQAQMNTNKEINIHFNTAVDQGSTYTYYVKAEEANRLHEAVKSNETTATIAVGLKGYIAVASDKDDLTSQELKAIKADELGNVNVDALEQASSLKLDAKDLNTNRPVYIYLSSVDKANNVSAPFKYHYNAEELELSITQKQDDKSKWTELTWTMPSWLTDYQLYRDGQALTMPANNLYTDKQDKIKPNVPDVVQAMYQNGKVSLAFLPATDVETTHTYKITAKSDQKTYEDTAEGIVVSGIKGYKITVDNQAQTKASGDIITSFTEIDNHLKWISGDLGSSLSANNIYVHIASVDNEGNESDSVHIPIAVGYPKVELSLVDASTGGLILTPYSVDQFGPSYKEKILSPAFLVSTADAMKIHIEASKLQTKRYQFIQSDIKPNFPVAESTGWQTISNFSYTTKIGNADWSAPQYTTTGVVEPSDYNQIRLDAQVALPLTEGTYYFALELEMADGKPSRQVLYGPFKLGTTILPKVYNQTPNNFTLPQGYSHIEYDAAFDTDFKDVIIRLDMDELTTQEIDTGQKIVSYRLQESVLTISNLLSGETKIIKLKDLGGQYSGSDYQITILSSNGIDNQINMTFLNEVANGSKYVISALIPTTFKPEVQYHKYLEFIQQKNQPANAAKVLVTVIGKPKLQEATDEKPALYREEPVDVTKSKTVSYLPMPKIN